MTNFAPNLKEKDKVKRKDETLNTMFIKSFHHRHLHHPKIIIYRKEETFTSVSVMISIQTSLYIENSLRLYKKLK